MLDKERVITRITDSGIVAVVRTQSAEQAKRIAGACLEGGIPAIEITFTVPGAHRVIEELAKTYPNGEMVLGAGTVLDAQTARVAILSGAQYVVSPSFDPELVRLCNRYRVASMPGAMTVGEAVRVLESGADIIKIFPGELFGPKMIRALHGPLPQAKIMPTGGVSLGNVSEWIKAGAVAVGAGGALTGGADTGDYASITATGREFVRRIRETRAALGRE